MQNKWVYVQHKNETNSHITVYNTHVKNDEEWGWNDEWGVGEGREGEEWGGGGRKRRDEGILGKRAGDGGSAITMMTDGITELLNLK
jgi:hypothetical protein